MARKNRQVPVLWALILVTALVFVLGLWGCDAFERWMNLSDSDSSSSSQSAQPVQQQSSSSAQPTQQEQSSSSAQPTQQEQSSASAQPTQQEQSSASAQPTQQTQPTQQEQSSQAAATNVSEPNGYLYSQLSGDDREKYRAMLEAYESRTRVDYPGTDVDGMERIHACVMADNPELFYIEGYTYYTRINSAGQVTEISIEGRYSFSAEESASLQKKIDSAVATCLAGAPKGTDDYAKAKYFYEYLAANVTYDHAAEAINESTGVYSEGQTIVESLVNHSSVCTGYARAFQHLLHQMNVPCIIVTGQAHGGAHVWCVAYLDGNWYFVDPTWGDSSILDDNGNPSGAERLDYDYLCVTGDDLSATHALDCSYQVPACTANADNYYVREGLYLSYFDAEAVGAIVRAAAERGDGVARFRCADWGVYDQVFTSLINNGEMYRFIPGDSYVYYKNDAMCTVAVCF